MVANLYRRGWRTAPRVVLSSLCVAALALIVYTVPSCIYEGNSDEWRHCGFETDQSDLNECNRDECCMESYNCWADQGCHAYVTCVTNCSDDACQSQCGTTYAGAGYEIGTAWISCLQTNCSGYSQ